MQTTSQTKSSQKETSFLNNSHCKHNVIQLWGINVNTIWERLEKKVVGAKAAAATLSAYLESLVKSLRAVLGFSQYS